MPHHMDDGRPRRTNPGIARTCYLALLYAVLTVALTYPLARHAGDHVLSGGPDTDLVLWALSWDTHAFTHQPLSIFDANIFYPEHRTLAYAENMIGSAFFAAPILWLTHNPILAMNTVVLLSCVLCGVGAYVLARRVGIGWHGAALSGLIFAFAPPRFLRLDQLFLATIAWVPFSLAYLHAYLDTGDRFDLRKSAAFFTLQALTSGHGAVFLALAASGLVAYRMTLGTPLALTTRLRDLGTVGALLLAPVVLMGIAYARVQSEIGLKRSLGDWWIVSAASFLASPTYVHDFVLTRLFPEAQINQHAGAYLFPGYLPLLLATLALLRPGPAESPERSDRWRRAAVAADLAVFASGTIATLVSLLGPLRVRLATHVIFSARAPWRAWSAAAVAVAIRIGIARRAPFKFPRVPGVVKMFKRWLAARRADPATFYVVVVVIGVWLSIGPPFGLWPFVYWLPGFNFIRASSRFMLLTVLGLSVLAGAGFECVSLRRAASARLLLAAIVAMLLVAEFTVPLGPVPYRVTLPNADRWLAEQPTPFAVAEVPLPDPAHVWEFEKRQSEYMLHSTAHWQKTVHGWSGVQPPRHLDLYYRLTKFPNEDSVRALTDFRVDYLVVHADLYAPGEWTQVQRRLSPFRDRLELRYADNTARVYAVKSPIR
jgi:hypothetical protein